jgi:hypothetical protein
VILLYLKPQKKSYKKKEKKKKWVNEVGYVGVGYV